MTVAFATAAGASAAFSREKHWHGRCLLEAQVMSPTEVHQQLVSAFPDAQIDVVDLTGTHDHYQATIVSAAFEGKTPIQQHQLVYRALGAAMYGPIHALALKTYTPQTWDQMQRGSQ
jgi:stress-induced morphogen